MTDPTPRGRTRADQHQHAGTRPAVRAAVVTVDPPARRAPGRPAHRGAHRRAHPLARHTEGTLRDTDALLVLAGRPTLDGTAARPTTVYVGTDLDDATVWARAVKLRADHVVVLPDPEVEAQLRRWLREHLDAAA